MKKHLIIFFQLLLMMGMSGAKSAWSHEYALCNVLGVKPEQAMMDKGIRVGLEVEGLSKESQKKIYEHVAKKLHTTEAMAQDEVSFVTPDFPLITTEPFALYLDEDNPEIIFDPHKEFYSGEDLISQLEFAIETFSLDASYLRQPAFKDHAGDSREISFHFHMSLKSGTSIVPISSAINDYYLMALALANCDESTGVQTNLILDTTSYVSYRGEETRGRGIIRSPYNFEENRVEVRRQIGHYREDITNIACLMHSWERADSYKKQDITHALYRYIGDLFQKYRGSKCYNEIAWRRDPQLKIFLSHLKEKLDEEETKIAYLRSFQIRMESDFLDWLSIKFNLDPVEVVLAHDQMRPYEGLFGELDKDTFEMPNSGVIIFSHNFPHKEKGQYHKIFKINLRHAPLPVPLSDGMEEELTEQVTALLMEKIATSDHLQRAECIATDTP